MRLALSAAVLMLAVTAIAMPASAADSAAKLRQNQQQLDRVRERMQVLAQTLQRDRGQQGELEQQLEASEKTLAEASAALAAAQREVQQQAARVSATQTERAAAQLALQQQRDALARQLRSAYMIGQQDRTQLLLNQDDAQQLGRVMTYYDYLNRARAARIDLIRQQAEALAALEQRLQQELSALEVLRSRQASALQALDASRAQRKTALTAVRQRISGSEGEIAQLRASEKEIQKLLESLRDALSDIPAIDPQSDGKPFGKLRGKLPWPARGKLLASFGAQKAGGPLVWNGIWIAASEGTPVRAVARGRVAYAGWLQRFGLMLILEHEGGYFTLYGHNQSIARSVGEWVSAGQSLGAAGASGGHEQSGVYFEIRRGSDPLDPAAWLLR